MTYEEKRARHAAYMRQWRVDNAERWQEIAGPARKRWKENHRDQHREAQRNHRHQVRQEILALLGDGCCAKCGYDADWRALEIDHIHSDGKTDKRLRQNMWWVRDWLKRNLEFAKTRYQVLCANCNRIKRDELKEYPHTAGWEFRRKGNAV